MRSKRGIALGAAALAVAVVALVFAQTGSPGNQTEPLKVPEKGVMNLSTGIGSFVMEGKGRVEISFTGTLFISKRNATFNIISGRLKKEYDNLDRESWFGENCEVVIEGEWRKIIWFGKDLNAKWVGQGVARLFGEYDKRAKEKGIPPGLETGSVQVDDLPPRKWGTLGYPKFVPKEHNPAWAAMQERERREGNPPPGGSSGTE